MASTTDIGKLYSLMDENPNKYKEIAANEHQLKIARANWPLMQTMASRPVDIPDVLPCEKLVERVEVKLPNRQAETARAAPRPAVDIVQKAREMALHDAGDSSVGMASSLTDDALNVVEMATANVREPVKSHVVDRPASQVPTLAHLFNKARETALVETGNASMEMASSLKDDALKVVEMASSLLDDALNVVEMTKAECGCPVKSHVVDSPASQVPTVAHLFNKARETALLETGGLSVEMASSLRDDALKVVKMATSLLDDALNVVEMTKANVREPVKSHVVDRPASKAPTLANLFSRLETDPRSKSLSPVFLKVGQS